MLQSFLLVSTICNGWSRSGGGGRRGRFAGTNSGSDGISTLALAFVRTSWSPLSVSARSISAGEAGATFAGWGAGAGGTSALVAVAGAVSAGAA